VILLALLVGGVISTRGDEEENGGGAQQCFSSFDFTSENGQLNVNGIPFVLKGVSWFGYETSNNVFHGLWARDYHDLLNFIKNNSFNAIRVPFYLELVLNDAKPNSINFYQMNTDLQNLTSLQVLDKIIAAAADIGLLIMLDLHSFEAGTFMEDGLWYDATHPESMVLQGWDTLIKRYANQWNVVAFDLKNEPWATTWGGANATDWNAGSTRVANHILSLLLVATGFWFLWKVQHHLLLALRTAFGVRIYRDLLVLL